MSDEINRPESENLAPDAESLSPNAEAPRGAGEITRRGFMRSAGAAAAGLALSGGGLTGCASLGNIHPAVAPAILKGPGLPSDKIRMALIGCGGRGTNVMEDFMRNKEVEVLAVCDPDSNRAGEFGAAVEKKYGRKPQQHGNYRKILENKDLDAVLVATPDHWHCLAMVHACEAGLDVYVEKPIAHNIVEGRAMVNAARGHQRIAQVGTQQRSAKHFQDAVNFVQSGALGQITLVRTWNNDYEMPNGLGAGTSELPAGVDYNMWLGAAPEVPFNSNRFHYQWRWFYDYAGGMLCDWGIHLIDIALWGMKARAPEFVTCVGGLYAVPDNRTTPDTIEATFQFGATEVAPKGFVMTYSNTKAAAHGTLAQGPGYGIEFHGINGALFVDRGGWQVRPYEKDGKAAMEAVKKSGMTANGPHIRNFLDCVKSRQAPISDIEIGHRSTTVPMLANIALRTGEGIRWDADKEEIVGGSKKATQLLGRTYRKPWDKEAQALPVSREMKKLLVSA